jgi:hypothetical protein
LRHLHFKWLTLTFSWKRKSRSFRRQHVVAEEKNESSFLKLKRAARGGVRHSLNGGATRAAA